jgi:hypothetical protein
MSLRSVAGKALAAFLPTIFIGGYNFRDSRERADQVREFVRQVYQQISPQFAGLDIGSAAADGHRGARTFRAFAPDFVRHEAAVAKGPQQLVQLTRVLSVGSANVHGVLQPVCLFREATGEQIAGRFTRSGKKVEVDACHHSADHAQRLAWTLLGASLAIFAIRTTPSASAGEWQK